MTPPGPGDTPQSPVTPPRTQWGGDISSPPQDLRLVRVPRGTRGRWGGGDAFWESCPGINTPSWCRCHLWCPLPCPSVSPHSGVTFACGFYCASVASHVAGAEPPGADSGADPGADHPRGRFPPGLTLGADPRTDPGILSPRGRSQVLKSPPKAIPGSALALIPVPVPPRADPRTDPGIVFPPGPIPKTIPGSALALILVPVPPRADPLRERSRGRARRQLRGAR